MPPEGVQQLATPRFPQFHSVVGAPAGQDLATTVKRNASDSALVPPKNLEHFAGTIKRLGFTARLSYIDLVRN